jgi:hypothetical protein
MQISGGLVNFSGGMKLLAPEPFRLGVITSTHSPTLNGTTTTTSNPYTGVTANSYNMNGSSNYLSIPGNSNWAMGTGDFTVEWWQYQRSTGSAPRIFSVGNYSTASWAVSIESNIFYHWENSSYRFSNSMGTYLNTWLHFAICRIGNVTKVYKNGTQIGSQYVDNNNMTDASTTLAIGQESSPTVSNYFDGYITSFRICKGLGVYTGNFTAPTSPLAQTTGANPYGGSNTSAISAGKCVLLLNP